MQRVALYEWALCNDPGLSSPRQWANHFVTHMCRIWPKDQLGDPAVRGQTIGFSVASIYQFLGKWKAKYNRNIDDRRAAASDSEFRRHTHETTRRDCVQISMRSATTSYLKDESPAHE